MIHNLGDFFSLVIVVMGLSVLVINLVFWRHCAMQYRWIKLYNGIAGLCLAVVHVLILSHLGGFNGIADLLPPEIMRASVILVLGAMLAGAVYTHRSRFYRGDC